MMKKLLGAAAVVAFAATTAVAGYVPGPLPPPFLGGYVAANPDVFKDEQKAAKAGAKLAGATSKCYSKGAKNVSKGKVDGVVACAAAALAAYNTAIGTLANLPPCSNAPTNGPLIQTLVQGFQAGNYCASPSGAFVDGTAGL